MSQHADAHDAMDAMQASDRGLSTLGIGDPMRAMPLSRIPVQFLLRHGPASLHFRLCRDFQDKELVIRFVHP